MKISSQGLLTDVLIAMAIVLPNFAEAQSQWVLPYPSNFGKVLAGTYNNAGQRVGDSRFFIHRLENGNVRLLFESAITGGAQTNAEAELEPIEAENGLRPVLQRSTSLDAKGNLLGVLLVDHRRGEASCTPPAGSASKVSKVELPDNDRVINVPLNLLFQPLVKGDVKRVDFQIFLCSGGARLVDFAAKVVPLEDEQETRGIIEVTYGPDLGKALSLITAPLTPKFSFWFDNKNQGAYVGHKMPLYAKGPKVFITRDGLSPCDFTSIC